MIHMAGKNLVNPISSILCASYMLVHLGLENHALSIRQAIRKVLVEGKIRTQDMGGNSSTDQLTEAIIQAL
jgi:isocitrate dehydrogenase (NAD+)